MTASDLGFVHRFVPAPDNGGAPTLLLLHGTGGSEDDLLDLGMELTPSANRLSPRGKVLENGMPRFFRRLAEGVFDEEDLVRRAHELADFVAAASAAYGFDARRVVAVGYSNGANVAGGLLLLRPESVAGAVLFRPMVPLTPEPLPDLAGKPVYIGAGRFDPLVAPDETERLARLLESAGAAVTVDWREAAHGLGPEDVEAARAWLAENLPR